MAPLLGSTTEHVVRTAACPVFLLPPDYLKNKKNSSTKPQLRHILVNYDFTPEVEEILGFAFVLAQRFKAEIHLLHVLPNSERTSTELSSNSTGQKILEKMLLEKMEDAILAGTGDWCRVVKTVRFGDRQNALLKYAKNAQIDLVCTPVPKPKFLFETVFPTKVGHLLQHSVCPVMVKSVSLNQGPGKSPARKICRCC